MDIHFLRMLLKIKHKQTGKRGNRMRRKHQLQHTDMEETQTKLKALTETRANLERQKMKRLEKYYHHRKTRENIIIRIFRQS